jgi:hypothetical protein
MVKIVPCHGSSGYHSWPKRSCVLRGYQDNDTDTNFESHSLWPFFDIAPILICMYVEKACVSSELSWSRSSQDTAGCSSCISAYLSGRIYAVGLICGRQEIHRLPDLHNKVLGMAEGREADSSYITRIVWEIRNGRLKQEKRGQGRVKRVSEMRPCACFIHLAVLCRARVPSAVDQLTTKTRNP